MSIKSILVKDRGFYFVEDKQDISLGLNYFSSIQLSEDWFQCYDYDDKLVKVINKSYVVEINY